MLELTWGQSAGLILVCVIALDLMTGSIFLRMTGRILFWMTGAIWMTGSILLMFLMPVAVAAMVILGPIALVLYIVYTIYIWLV